MTVAVSNHLPSRSLYQAETPNSSLGKQLQPVFFKFLEISAKAALISIALSVMAGIFVFALTNPIGLGASALIGVLVAAIFTYVVTVPLLSGYVWTKIDGYFHPQDDSPLIS